MIDDLLCRSLERWHVDALGRLGHLASGRTATTRLFGYAAPLVQCAATEQPLHQFNFIHHGIIAPDLTLHRVGRAAALQQDHRIPARFMRHRQDLDEARHSRALLGGSIRPLAGERPLSPTENVPRKED